MRRESALISNHPRCAAACQRPRRLPGGGLASAAVLVDGAGDVGLHQEVAKRGSLAADNELTADLKADIGLPLARRARSSRPSS
jgi:hypothetical protein